MGSGGDLWVKVCGMTNASNVAAVASLGVSRIGFIFHPRSPRYVGRSAVVPRESTASARRIGVFVDAPVEEVYRVIEEWSLDGVQLHGRESPAYCRDLRRGWRGEIFKAVGVFDRPLGSLVAPYDGEVDGILLDTRLSPSGTAFSERPAGGTGRAFDWRLLDTYQVKTPFIVAGGVGLTNIEELLRYRERELFVGIDLNSKVESDAGVKDTEKVRQVVTIIQGRDKRGDGERSQI
jgi:phosphoribosylanthranilate isomerase